MASTCVCRFRPCMTSDDLVDLVDRVAETRRCMSFLCNSRPHLGGVKSRGGQLNARRIHISGGMYLAQISAETRAGHQAFGQHDG